MNNNDFLSNGDRLQWFQYITRRFKTAANDELITFLINLMTFPIEQTRFFPHNQKIIYFSFSSLKFNCSFVNVWDVWSESNRLKNNDQKSILQVCMCIINPNHLKQIKINFFFSFYQIKIKTLSKCEIQFVIKSIFINLNIWYYVNFKNPNALTKRNIIRSSFISLFFIQ